MTADARNKRGWPEALKDPARIRPIDNTAMTCLQPAHELSSAGIWRGGVQLCRTLALTLATTATLCADEVVHHLRSQRQAGETTVRVFLPDAQDVPVRPRLLLVLPVEAGTESRWGDPAAEIRRTDIANRHKLVVAVPTFTDLPWYANHPSDEQLRQEAYLLRDVLPLIDRNHGTESQSGQTMLVGFSKSGWGAWSLLLRNPSIFARAAAWDAPLMQSKPDKYGMGPIFGNQANFNRYFVSELVKRQAKLLRMGKRLVLTGYFQSFRTHHVAMHKLLKELGVPHDYRDGPKRDHHWESGWLDEAVGLLLSP